MEVVGSLHDLCHAPDSRTELPHACVVSDELFTALHAVEHTRDGFRDDLDALVQHCVSSSSALNSSPSGTALSTVAAFAREGVAGSDGGFPGPMCSPLRRTHGVMVRSGCYTFTEKSDGVRVVTVALLVRRFPRWRIASTGASSTDATASGCLQHLLEIARLESAAAALSTIASAQVHLWGRVYSVTRATNQSNADLFSLRLREDGAHSAVPTDCDISLQRTTEDRFVCYSVERTMASAYLLLDSPAHPFPPEYSRVVVDGELVIAFPNEDSLPLCRTATTGARTDGLSSPPPRVLLAMFDIFALESVSGARSLTADLSMKEREELLRSMATAAGAADQDASGITFYVKDMLPVTELSTCVSRLRRIGGSYWYKGRFGLSRNDGLVFTPDQFPLRSGASRTQVKWKWRSLLSVDWLISRSEKDPDQYNVWLYFCKKNHGYRPDSVGHWRCEKTMALKNPHNFRIPTEPSQRVVAECVYDWNGECWVVERLRSDKAEANSIVTAISVFESLAENLTLGSLCELLGLGNDNALRCMAAKLDPEQPPLTTMQSEGHCRSSATASPAPLAKLCLRAFTRPSGQLQLSLLWLTNGGNPDFRNGIPCALCDVRECSGLGLSAAVDGNHGELGGSKRTDLENYLLIELGNAGGSCSWSDFVVDAFFDGVKGRWVIVKINPHGSNRQATFDRLLDHLGRVLGNGGGSSALHAAVQECRDAVAHIPTCLAPETQLTNAHYANKANELSGTNGEDNRGKLRRFNNWIKTMLISEAAARLSTASGHATPNAPRSRRGGMREMPGRGYPRNTSDGGLVVADLCCGRGGDLWKWKAIHPAFVFMADSSFECVAEAAARYSVSKGLSTKSNEPGVCARFCVHDVFDERAGLLEALEAVKTARQTPFHLVSCQFSLHYGCSTAGCLDYFLKCVAAALLTASEDKPCGGLFIGTTVNDSVLLEKYRMSGDTFGSSNYRIRFPPESAEKLKSCVVCADDGQVSPLPFGVKYFTTVEDSVTDLPEYVVPWPRFVDLARLHDLHLVLDSPFHRFTEERLRTPKGEELFSSMMGHKNAREEGRGHTIDDFHLNPSEEEAISVYRVFAFEKRKLPASCPSASKSVPC